MTRILLDTHVLLWALLSPAELSPGLRRTFKDPKTAIVVSTASAWEIATKHRLGKLPQAAAVVDDYAAHLRVFVAEELEITSAHALLAGRLAGSHRDPFDRMLAAQSILEGLPLATSDPAFRVFPVRTVW